MSSRRTKQGGDTCSNLLVDCSANLGDTRGGEIRARPARDTDEETANICGGGGGGVVPLCIALIYIMKNMNNIKPNSKTNSS